MKRQYATLLPAEAEPSSESPRAGPTRAIAQRSVPPKRSQVSAACKTCQQKKAKCDGQRPACSYCRAKNVECVYDTEEGDASRTVALRRERNALQHEVDDFKQLFGFIRNRPETEAFEIYNRVRTSNNPIEVLSFIRQADLLLPDPSPETTRQDPRRQKINVEALESSPIKVPARPWTAAVDDGLASELISSFFAWDEPFIFQFIDRQSFLREMRAQEPREAKYCSGFLVNTICAVRCFTSARTKAFGRITGQNMGERFFDEAKRMFDLECGRQSLPTVQGLALLYISAANMGRDRPGMIYRYMMCGMLKRLNLERRIVRLKPDNPAEAQERRILSKALWGLFCFESICAYAYHQQASIAPPTVHRVFDDDTADKIDKHHMLVDGFGQPFTNTSHEPPLVSGILSAKCDLSEILFETMRYNNDELVEIGSRYDIRKRTELYTELMQWREDLSDGLKNEQNFVPQTCYLRVYVNEVAVAILRPLHPDTQLPGLEEDIKDLCINHCSLDVEAIERYADLWPLTESSTMTFWALYNASLTLAPLLYDIQAHEPFTKACKMLRRTAWDYPMARRMLLGLRALCWSLKQDIPQAALASFDNLSSQEENLEDLPVSLALPQHEAIRKLLSDDGQSPSSIDAQISTLISKWNAMSME